MLNGDICALFFFSDLPPQMGAVGALLDHLIRERAMGDLSNEGVEVHGIELLTLCVAFYIPFGVSPF